jgi:hypothetical protein
VGALLGTGLDTGAVRRGAAIRVAWAPTPYPVFLTIGAAVAGAPRDASGVGVSWTTLAVGLGPVTSAARGALRFDARLELVAERFAASVIAPDTGATDDGSRWSAGGRLGVDGAWMPTRVLGVVASAEGSLLGGATTVSVRGVPVGQDAPNGLGFAGFLGARAALP